MAISILLKIIALNVNELNALIKRHRMAKDIKKDPIYMLPARDSLQIYIHRLKMKGWKNFMQIEM